MTGQRNAVPELPENGLEISRLRTENSLLKEELTRTKRALEIAMNGLSNIKANIAGGKHPDPKWLIEFIDGHIDQSIARTRKELGE